MKLLSKTARYYLFISVPILIMVSIVAYFMIKNEIRNGIDEYLGREMLKSKDLMRNRSVSTPYYLNSDSLSRVLFVRDNNYKTGYTDTLISDWLEKEKIPYRKLTELYSSQDKTYLISLYKPTLEEDELLEGLFATFSIIIALLVTTLLVVNWFLSKKIWKPFYKTLDLLDKYEIKKHENYSFESQDIIEFNSLNASLNKLTNKVHNDYLRQKEFTENASHELQTPIAVIKANLNLLMQSANLREEEMELVQAIEGTAQKMGSLNKALLLLAKIENNQFSEVKTVNLKDVISRCLLNVEEQITVKNIRLLQECKENLSINANPSLIEILVSNLIQNAIRHNFEDGKINILLSDHALTVSNTGEPLNILPEELFVRFKKNDSSKDSLGLGLSIARGIADLYGFAISYEYDGGLHTFKIKFSKIT